MREITLNGGQIAIVDDNDFADLSQFKWSIYAYHYAARSFRDPETRKMKWEFMHRRIMKTPPGKDTDHIDGNALNNQKANLRICSHAQNMRNTSKYSTNMSGHKGVSWDSWTNSYAATITVNRKRIKIGRYKDVLSAAQAYDEAAKKYFGEFARLNEVIEQKNSC